MQENAFSRYTSNVKCKEGFRIGSLGRGSGRIGEGGVGADMISPISFQLHRVDTANSPTDLCVDPSVGSGICFVQKRCHHGSAIIGSNYPE